MTSKLENRYNNDPVFHKCVRCMYDLIVTHNLTPSELREAVFFAATMFELERPDINYQNELIRKIEFLNTQLGFKVTEF